MAQEALSTYDMYLTLMLTDTLQKQNVILLAVQTKAVRRM